MTTPATTRKKSLQPSTLRIGHRYRPSRLKQPYDALIIGSGIGGLTTAALLSELGWRVAVLEQHYTAGGATHSYERNGYEWDVGVHYIGDMGGATMSRRLMDFLTQGKVAWAPMDAHYDRFFIGDRTYDAVAGPAEFRDNLLAHFPREAAAIDRYLELLREVAARTQRPVEASGGISSLVDLEALRALVPLGVEGAIVGKALYSGAFTLPEALDVAGR